MTATDELRRMLDERGVEYFKHEDGEPLRKLEKADEPATSWHIGGAGVCAVPIKGSDLFDLWIDNCTPEQAAAIYEQDRKSRWFELFGTPEMAAMTMARQCFGATSEECNMCVFNECDGKLRNSGTYQTVYDALLEWLRGDA